MPDEAPVDAPPLEVMENLSRFHRAHEEFYASAPMELAVTLQRHGRTLLALADRWSVARASSRAPGSPFEGAEDLNSDVAIQLDGVLFMEGEGGPPEIARLVRDLRSAADDQRTTGAWLAAAMRTSWDVAAGLVAVDGLADVLGDRHRIIANDARAAATAQVTGQVLDRAADIVEHIDFDPSALRADLAAGRSAIARLRSAAELVDHAADLCCASAGLVHDNERRWRTFRAQVLALASGART